MELNQNKISKQPGQAGAVWKLYFNLDINKQVYLTQLFTQNLQKRCSKSMRKFQVAFFNAQHIYL